MYAKAVKLVSIAAFFLMFIWWFAAKSQLSSVGDGGYMELLALAVLFCSASARSADSPQQEVLLGGRIRTHCSTFQPFRPVDASSDHLSRIGRGLHLVFHPLTDFFMERT